MTHGGLLTVLALLLGVVLLHGVSTKLKLSFPIVLVLVGLAVSLAPGLPTVTLEPDLVFLVFMPPLLYEAAWFTSWREFKLLRNAIALQALGLVLFTAAAVAAVAHRAIPGCTWALGFLLGGIVSPPDAVAATSVLAGIRVPRLPVAVLEGESLVNDASSLIVVRFALAAVAAGTFSVGEALSQFFIVSFLGIAIGLAIAHSVFFLHRRLHGTPPVDVALTLLTPYLIYVAAEHAHASGVLGVVAGGLYLSARSHEFLSARARIAGMGTWGTVVFVLNGVVFILIGLQLPEVMRGLGETSVVEAVGLGLLVSVTAIAVRVLWTFPAAFLPSFLPWKPRPIRFPDYRNIALVAWAGMRGVVSLASVLAIPFLADDGKPFPLRAQLVFITFVVILVTLVGQGLSLPLVVKWLKFDSRDDEHTQERTLESRLGRVADDHLATVPDPASHASEHVQLHVVRLQRKELLHLRNTGDIEYELARDKEFELDLVAARLEARTARED